MGCRNEECGQGPVVMVMGMMGDGSATAQLGDAGGIIESSTRGP